MNNTLRTGRATALFGVSLLVLALGSEGAASAASLSPADHSLSAGRGSAPAEAELPSLLTTEELRQVNVAAKVAWPGLSDEDIALRDATQAARKLFLEGASVLAGFAGSDYDFQANVFTAYATDESGASALRALAATSGLKNIVVKNAPFSYIQLHSKEGQIHQALYLAAPGIDFGIGIDPAKSKVVVTAPTPLHSAVRVWDGDPMVAIELVDSYAHGTPASCTDRYNCGVPLRGGINIGLWRPATGSSDTGCSSGSLPPRQTGRNGR